MGMNNINGAGSTTFPNFPSHTGASSTTSRASSGSSHPSLAGRKASNGSGMRRSPSNLSLGGLSAYDDAEGFPTPSLSRSSSSASLDSLNSFASSSSEQAEPALSRNTSQSSLFRHASPGPVSEQGGKDSMAGADVPLRSNSFFHGHSAPQVPLRRSDSFASVNSEVYDGPALRHPQSPLRRSDSFASVDSAEFNSPSLGTSRHGEPGSPQSTIPSHPSVWDLPHDRASGTSAGHANEPMHHTAQELPTGYPPSVFGHTPHEGNAEHAHTRDTQQKAPPVFGGVNFGGGGPDAHFNANLGAGPHGPYGGVNVGGGGPNGHFNVHMGSGHHGHHGMPHGSGHPAGGHHGVGDMMQQGAQSMMDAQKAAMMNNEMQQKMSMLQMMQQTQQGLMQLMVKASESLAKLFKSLGEVAGKIAGGG